MLKGTELISIAKQYFDAWNNQNTNALDFLFTEDVTLTDWEISENGKEKVLQANQNIFNSVNDIEAQVQDIGYNDNKVYAELIIEVLTLDATNESEREKIKVLDVITIEDDSRISSISAYKQ
jgi:hypothetical protein